MFNNSNSSGGAYVPINENQQTVTAANDVQVDTSSPSTASSSSSASASLPTATPVSNSVMYDVDVTPPSGMNASAVKPTTPIAGGSPAGAGPWLTLQIRTTDDKTLLVRVSVDATVGDLKAKVHEASGYEPARQRLIFSGQLLSGEAKLLRDCRIKDGAFVHLVPKLLTAATATQPDTEGSNSPHHQQIGMQGQMFNNYNPYDFAVSIDEDGDLGGGAPGAGNNATYGGVTFVTHVWRSRVRMLASIMLFFYMLDLLGELSLFMDPEAAASHDVPKWRRDPMLNLLKLIEDVIGVMTGLVGLRASTSVDSRATIQFVRGIMVLSVMYMVNGVLDMVEMVQEHRADGADGNNTTESPTSGRGGGMHHYRVESLGFSIMAYALMGMAIWGSCIFTAAQYHHSIRQEETARGIVRPTSSTLPTSTSTTTSTSEPTAGDAAAASAVVPTASASTESNSISIA